MKLDMQQISVEQTSLIRSVLVIYDEMANIVTQINQLTQGEANVSSEIEALSHQLVAKMSEKTALVGKAKECGLTVWDKSVSVAIMPIHNPTELLNGVSAKVGENGFVLGAMDPAKGPIVLVMTNVENLDKARSAFVEAGYMDLDIDVYNQTEMHPNAVIAGLHKTEYVQEVKAALAQ